MCGGPEGTKGRHTWFSSLSFGPLSTALNLADTHVPPHTHVPHTKVNTVAALPALEQLSLIGNPISMGPR